MITVGSGGGSGPTTTAASGAGSNVALVTTPKAAVPRSAGKPAIYWAGWGLFAVGALLALMLIALYVRFTPGFNRQKRPVGTLLWLSSGGESLDPVGMGGRF